MIVDSQGIISVPRKKKKKNVFAGKFIVARAYAASAQVISWPSVTASATTNELTIQRVRLGSWRKTSLNALQSSALKSGSRVGDRVCPCKESDSANSSGRITSSAMMDKAP